MTSFWCFSMLSAEIQFHHSINPIVCTLFRFIAHLTLQSPHLHHPITHTPFHLPRFYSNMAAIILIAIWPQTAFYNGGVAVCAEREIFKWSHKSRLNLKQSSAKVTLRRSTIWYDNYEVKKHCTAPFYRIIFHFTICLRLIFHRERCRSRLNLEVIATVERLVLDRQPKRKNILSSLATTVICFCRTFDCWVSCTWTHVATM